MADPAPLAPRKLPRQRRSRVTVDAILDATARALLRGGYGAVNTNLVAELAGVSVGSLYQYFPNKQALVAALRRRHRERMCALVEARLEAAAQAPAEALAGAVAAAAIEAWRLDPALSRALELAALRVGFDPTVAEIDARSARRAQRLLAARRATRATGAPADDAWVMIRAASLLVREAALFAPERLESGRLEAQLSALLAGLLSG
jgi:AcrR family transcriptional regulator